MHKNYKHRFWGEARFFSLFRPFFVTCKACVHAGRRLLGQALTKGGELPEWVLKRNRIRIFQPSHGFLEKAEETIQNTEPKEDKEERPQMNIGERIQKWKRTALFDRGINHLGKRKIETLTLNESFNELLGQLVYATALEGRYLGGGRIIITKPKEIKQWIQKPTQNSNLEPECSFGEYQYPMKPPWEQARMEGNGYESGMN